MIREITRNDRDSFLRLSDEFYKSEAVLHDIPAAYHEAAFDELMRSKEYASAYMIEWDPTAWCRRTISTICATAACAAWASCCKTSSASAFPAWSGSSGSGWGIGGLWKIRRYYFTDRRMGADFR